MLKRPSGVFSTSPPSADQPVRTGMGPVLPLIRACVSTLPVKLQLKALRKNMKEWRLFLMKLWGLELIAHPVIYKHYKDANALSGFL